MGKIKIWGAFENQPLHTITYDSYDIESIAVAEEEKKSFCEKIFNERKDLKEVYVMGYEDDKNVAHTTITIKNPNYDENQYVFVVSIYGNINKEFKTKESAKPYLTDYFKTYHDEFEDDEIDEIVNELIAIGSYTIDKTKYFLLKKNP